MAYDEEEMEEEMDEEKEAAMDEDAVLDSIFADFEPDASLSDEQINAVAKVASVKKKGVKKISSVLGIGSDSKNEIEELSKILDAE